MRCGEWRVESGICEVWRVESGVCEVWRVEYQRAQCIMQTSPIHYLRCRLQNVIEIGLQKISLHQLKLPKRLSIPVHPADKLFLHTLCRGTRTHTHIHCAGVHGHTLTYTVQGYTEEYHTLTYTVQGYTDTHSHTLCRGTRTHTHIHCAGVHGHTLTYTVQGYTDTHSHTLCRGTRRNITHSHTHEGLMQGKCIHPKQPVIFKEKTELPRMGLSSLHTTY